MTPSLTRIAMTVTLLGTPLAATARQADSIAPTSGAPSAPADKVDAGARNIATVEVKGSTASYDSRRDDTASKSVLNHEEITRYGDTNVFDVLKRAPGVTVIGNSIRMRGLGNGYIQILVNGSRPPPGFSMESLTPEQIDRIEVMRAATAEHSTQAIAGTINIVLSKVVSRRQRDLRLHAGRSGEQRNTMAVGTLADRTGRLSYYVNAMVSHDVDQTPGATSARLTTPDGQLLQLRDKRSTRLRRNTGVGVQPRLNWKLDDDAQLNVAAYLETKQSAGAFTNRATRSQGSFALPDYANLESTADTHGHFAGVELNWVSKLWGGKLDAKFSVAASRFSVDTKGLSSDAGRAIALRRDAATVNTFSDLKSSGKYTRSLFEGHALAAGWDLDAGEAVERIDRVEGLAGAAPARTHEEFTPHVQRAALFAQDEWNLGEHWSMYLGGRWEGIRTRSEASGAEGSVSRSSVLSPIAQTLYKFPDKSGRQLRLALTRTYKAPTTDLLSARRNEADQNDRFNPDKSGNPRLRPELANGLDLTYEHFWAPGAVFSVGASARQIKDYIRSRLTQDAQGRWLIQPTNNGSARVRSVDVELKFPLKALRADAAPIELRASVGRNWSLVDVVPGPDNRLDQQIPLSAVVGADYKGERVSGGASFAFRGGGPVRMSLEQSSRMQVRRELDLYLLTKIRPGLQLRVAVKNALGEDTLGETRYADAQGISDTWSATPGSPRLQLNLEMKF